MKKPIAEINGSENSSKKKILLKGLTLQELQEYFVSIGEKKFRGEQIYKWMYSDFVTQFDEMLNLPESLRKKLKEEALVSTLEFVDSEFSQLTGTKKFVFQTKEKNKIESVIIPEEKRTTLCISTQVGCPLDCRFCATGLMGYKKNLAPGEIFDQYMLAANDYGKDKLTNIVYMGMGEPLLNFNSTIKSLELFTNESGSEISFKKITVSTAGIAPKIIDLANSGMKPGLAFSLHSCFENIRSKIMPINGKYSLKQNIEALKYYSKVTKTRITFEYVMLNNVNDSDKDINALVKLCSQMPSKINIIPFNSLQHMNPTGIAAELNPTPLKRISEFAQKLKEKDIIVMVRNTQGDDIAAACGQLAVKFN